MEMINMTNDKKWFEEYEAKLNVKKEELRKEEERIQILITFIKSKVNEFQLNNPHLEIGLVYNFLKQDIKNNKFMMFISDNNNSYRHEVIKISDLLRNGGIEACLY